MPFSRLIAKYGLNTQQMLAVVAALLFTAASAYVVVKLVEERYQTYLDNELQTVLQGMTESIRVWGREQYLQVQNLAQDEHILKITQALLAMPHEQGPLLAAPAQKTMRYEMRSYLESGFYEGYFIIGPDNISLASSRDANVGSPNLLTRYPELLQKVWAGDTHLTPIQRSDVTLQRGETETPSGNETMFVATPIKDKSGTIIALLTLRINPYKTLFPIMETARLGITGDSYAFDRYGTLLSKSRYEDELVRIGVLQPGQSSASNLKLLDPGFDLSQSNGIRPALEGLPLTRMAASATRGQEGVDLEGYRDFRGVPVVGAWKWDQELGFGFAVEQSGSEAYGVYHFMRWTTVGGAIIAALILVVLVVVFASGKRQIASVQRRLQAIVETASDGIVVIDQHGCIESVNPATEKMFGYRTEQLLGHNVSMLMPDPHRSFHDTYLTRYLETGENRVIGIGRETEGQHSDGTAFPIELSVNRLELDSGLHFAGVVRDISERKKAEQALEQQRDFTRDVIDSLSAHIAVLDAEGKIVLTNRAWKKFAEQNNLPADQVDTGVDYLQAAMHLPDTVSEEATDVGQQLQQMLDGGINKFSLKYPCHSPQEQRWFEMRANSFMHHDRLAIVVSHTNITRQVEFERRLKDANEQLRITSLVAEITDNAVIVTDLKGVTQWVNRGFTLLSGYKFDEIVGQRPGELLQGEETDMAVSHRIGEAVRAGKRIEGEILNYHKNGTPYWIHFEISPVYDEQQKLVQFVALEQDITERKRSEQAIIKAREEAENANRAKSTFLATMSHEIRTPLYGVVGTVDMLGHTQLDSSQTDLVNTAKDSAMLLQGIIDDILDFSKIEAGKLELERVPLTLEPLVEKLGENLQHLAAKRNVELLIYSDPRLPEVKGDPVRLRQILYNLAGNAIKFSSGLPDRNGQVIIRALLENQKNGRVNLCFSISDNGIGMNIEVQKRLFMPFVQGEEETTRRYGGTGLGLVITERLVEMMDGYIDLESVEGEGSTFSVHLSLEQVADAPRAEVSNLKGLKVVLVNDNNDVAWMLTSYLQHAGAEVIAVTHDEIADVCREACKGHKEPVVVIDTEGDQDVAHMLREKMRKTVKDVELRFVLVERGRRRYARAHGGDSMTLDLNAMRRATLLNAVAAVAGRESPIQEIALPNEVIPDITLSVDEAREQGRLILLADDNETNRKLIKQQLQMLGYLAEAVNDGKEALELWRDGGYAMLMTDCHMPVMDGYQLAEAVRSEETGEERKPIVAITADALKGTAQKCFAAGMDDYLTKPIELHRLRTMLDKWLPDTASRKQAELETGKEKEENADEVMDPQALGRLLDTQDREMLSEYYINFLETSTPTVEQIRFAFHEGDLPVISSLAHKLKSSARTVGANALADCCLALETAGNDGDAQTISQQMLRFFRLFDQVHDWIDQYGKAK